MGGHGRERRVRITSNTHWFVALKKPKLMRKSTMRKIGASMFLLVAVLIAVVSPTPTGYIFALVIGSIAGWELVKKGRR